MSPDPTQTNTEPVCARCGLWCLIAHKAHGVESEDGTVIWYHDAHADDCWRKEIEDRMKRAEA